jgi:hypothetical protein
VHLDGDATLLLWSVIARLVIVLVYSSSRSDSVVLPWSTWAMMQKLRVRGASFKMSSVETIQLTTKGHE